jgi:PASTA domain-containing protein
MPFDVPSFVFGKMIMEREGVPADESTRLAMFPAISGLPMVQNVLISTVIGRSNAAPPPAAPVEPVPPVELVQVPDLVGDTFETAEGRLKLLGLLAVKKEVTSEKADVVVDQKPEAGTVVPKNDSVDLLVGKPVVTLPAGPEGPPK